LPRTPNLINKQNPGPIAGFATIVCVALAVINLVLGLQSGGIPPEFPMFLILAFVFGVVWLVARRI
jgi:uncharacterized membrane protein